MRMALLVAAFIILAPDLAFASMGSTCGGSGGGGLPWETPMQTLCTSIQGPVAYAISLLGLISAGAMLVWGGEINEFVRRIIMLVLVISLIAFAANILTTLFASGALV